VPRGGQPSFPARGLRAFLCECGDEHCREIVMLTIEDHEHVRARPAWFLLVAGHED
jgi:hypothetical protein